MKEAQVNKRTWLMAALALGMTCGAPALAQQAPQPSPQPAAAPVAGAAGLDAVTPFITENTDLVVAIDLSNVNAEQVHTWMQNQMQKAGVDKATMDKMQEEAKPEMEKATQWLTQFKQAGGRRMYVVASVQEIMTHGPVVIVPVEGQADGQALAKIFEAQMDGAAAPGAAPGAEAPAADKPVAAMVGRSMVIGKQEAVNAAKTPQPAARPELMQALGATATVKIAVSGLSLAKAGQVGGMPLPPQVQGIEWLSFNLNAPPAIGASLTVQAKDAATAKQVSDSMNQALAMMQQMPQVQQALGNNVGALTAALTPKITNRRIMVALDSKTIEGTLMPVAIKGFIAERAKMKAAQPPVESPGAEPKPGL
jgi:hypothetical protein